MRRIVFGIFAFGMLVLMAFSASAQGPGGFRGMGGGIGGPALVGNKSVQEELKLTDEQKEKLKGKLEEMGPKMKEAFTKLKDTPKEEMKEKMGGMMKEINEAAQKEIDAVLTKEQSKRFKQIELQVRGLEAFSDETVVKELKITDEQKEKLKGIREEIGKDMSELRKMMKDDFAGAMKKMTGLRKEGMEKAAELLTADQKKAWKGLTGEAFEIKMEGGGRPFGKKKDE